MPKNGRTAQTAVRQETNLVMSAAVPREPRTTRALTARKRHSAHRKEISWGPKGCSDLNGLLYSWLPLPLRVGSCTC